MISPKSSVLINIGDFSIHYYGVIMFAAIISALLIIRFIAKKYYKDIDTEIILDILPVIILSAILGARIYYVLMDLPYFSSHLNEIFAIWHGGMSIHGGILGGIISGAILAKIKKINFLKYADVFSYGIIIGQAIGRFGNWFNCEAFGKPCFIPVLKLFIPKEHRPFGYENFEYFHPTFLYESLWNIFVFIILFTVIRKIPNIKEGTIFFSYLILYSIGRFFIEWCRIDSVRNILGLPVAQVVSVLIILVCSIILFFIYSKEKVRR